VRRMKIHMSAIAGTAMASLAGLLRERGHEVTGSDQDIYPPMSTQLEELGIPVRSPYAESNVPEDAELVVIGNALSRGNPEVEIVLDRKQRMASLPSILAEHIIRGHESLVVAGTHGKTTTTSMLAFLLDQAGLDPSFLIGGVPADFSRSYRLAKGKHFVVEGDEYDSAFFDKRPKFVHYLPDIAVIGNLEFDHADIYPDLAAVQLAFVRLMQMIPRKGLLVAGIESAPLREILPRAMCRVETFTLGSMAADWRGQDAGPAPDGGWKFRLGHGGKDLGEYSVQLPGEHNVRNAIAAIAVASAVGVAPEKSREILARFRGVKRRLEVKGKARGVIVYDDFAHHPTAVRETLHALQMDKRAGGRLVAVFEPRSYTSRTRVFQDDFAKAFEGADAVIVAAAHLPGKVPESERLSEADLVHAMEARGQNARFIGPVDEIVAHLARDLREGDRVVILSNGGFGGIHGKLLAALAQPVPLSR
jgi:UDP-N-acetylmuramate: L-alanyl-gamma-D-glutamyl-meso-diaminopimelate ligase